MTMRAEIGESAQFGKAVICRLPAQGGNFVNSLQLINEESNLGSSPAVMLGIWEKHNRYVGQP